ncbi:MAG: class I SAM-dependent methyltransferase [Cellvibrionaceae bacterium]
MDSSVYVRPNKPKRIEVKNRERNFPRPTEIKKPEILSVDRSTECHVTPAETAGRMIDYLNLENGLSVLEPECGTGNLIDALTDSGYDLSITAVERFIALYQASRVRFAENKGIDFINECFLEFAENTNQRFDRIVMNPPFRQTKKHIEAAISLLNNNGLLIALVPVTYQREEIYEIEVLERGIFSTANVLTKIIEYEF